MTMLGHNKGPSMEAGYGWRKHCWQKARRNLMPTLPIEILKSRVKRSKELGLDYKSYASIRAASGHDVIAFLFSSNALRVLPRSPGIPPARYDKLIQLQDCTRLVGIHQPMPVSTLETINGPSGAPLFDHIFVAPSFADTWGQTKDTILKHIHAQHLPRDGVVVIGDTDLERGWFETAGLGGYLAADRFFPTP